MARLHVPALALGFLLFIAAALAGMLFLLLGTRAYAGAAWALIVLLTVGVAMVVVTVLRRSNKSRSEQP